MKKGCMALKDQDTRDSSQKDEVVKIRLSGFEFQRIRVF
jgi:hypothetical protein